MTDEEKCVAVEKLAKLRCVEAGMDAEDDDGSPNWWAFVNNAIAEIDANAV